MGKSANLKLTSTVGIPNDYIPSDYDDLYRTYGSFVTRLVTHYNRIPSNFDDLLGHTWLKIVENKVILKYNSSGGSLPKRLTALQACGYLRMTWGSFKTMLHRHNVGDDRLRDKARDLSLAVRNEVFARDKGVCSCCGRDAHKFGECLRIGQQRPAQFEEKFGWTVREVRTQIGVSPNQKYFWFVEKDVQRVGRKPLKNPGKHRPTTYTTVCFLCWRKRHTENRCKSAWAPQPVEGTWSSRRAKYDREDIERVKVLRDSSPRRSRPTTEPIEPLPEMLRTKSFFKLYLARAVHNIYANWCRTRDRRYKEFFPGADVDTGRSWEETLEDPMGSNQETLLALYEASKLLAYGPDKDGGILTTHEDVLCLIAEGHKVTDIIQKLSLPKGVLRLLQT